ncbi:MAG: HD domain-containing protein [archaeon]
MDKTAKYIEEYVKKIYCKESFNYHVKIVAKYCGILAEKLNVDSNLMIVCGYLHDIGYELGKGNPHEQVSAFEAGKILKQINFSQQKIEIIKSSILKHTTDTLDKDRTKIEEKILANADVIAHIEAAYYIMAVPYIYKGKSFDEGFYWFKKKMYFEYSDKLSLPQAKELVKDKYLLVKKLIDNFEQFIE